MAAALLLLLLLLYSHFHRHFLAVTITARPMTAAATATTYAIITLIKSRQSRYRSERPSSCIQCRTQQPLKDDKSFARRATSSSTSQFIDWPLLVSKMAINWAGCPRPHLKNIVDLLSVPFGFTFLIFEAIIVGHQCISNFDWLSTVWTHQCSTSSSVS